MDISFYEKIFSDSPVGMTIYDSSGQCIAANNSICKIIGTSKENVLSQNFHHIESWKSCGLTEKAIEATTLNHTTKKKVSLTSEFGKDLTANVKLQPFTINNSDFLLCTFDDISEQILLDEDREYIHEKYRHSIDLMHYVVSHARSAIAVHDRDLNYVYVSDRYLDEYGVKDRDVIGKHHYEVFPDLPQKWRDVHQRCLNGEILSAEEDPYCREDGSVDWTRWECRPWYELDGTVGGIIVYTEVITERKVIEEKLRKSEEQLQLAIEGAELGFWDWNIETGETYFSERYFSMLGYNSTDLPHAFETWEKLLHPEEKENVLKTVNECMDKDFIWHIEFRLQTKQGDYKWILSRGKVVEKSSDGSPIRATGTHLDISGKKQGEEDLLKIQKLESVGILAGGIAHDFNNILSAILGNVSLALYDSQLTTETKELLMEAEKASHRAKDLTSQLLTFSKGGLPVKKTASLVEVVKTSAKFILHGDKTACKYSIPENLWSADIDKGQIGQVVQNIVLNASQAMPGGGTIEIGFENHVQHRSENTTKLSPGKYIKLTLKDTGIGIPERLLDKIFDPYFTTKQKGSGLGLAITHSIIHKHGGDIQVESLPGVGSTFKVFLPASEKSPPVAEQKKNINIHKNQARILIMDDEEQVRNILQAMLKRIGHETFTAKDGKEVLTLYKEAKETGSPIDLIIMDLTIPGGMGGKEAAEEVLKLDPEAKVIVASGYSNDPIMANYKEYGFCAAISKPFMLEELFQVISQNLEPQ